MLQAPASLRPWRLLPAYVINGITVALGIGLIQLIVILVAGPHAAQLVVSGAERTTVFATVQSVARAFDLAIQPDDHPEAGHYYRSDHFSLARVGVPAFSVNEGKLYRGHDLAWGQAREEDYRAHRYHQPKDEYTPDMDFTGDAKVAKFGFAIGWQVANAAELIGWQPGDEFERARKQSQ